MSATDLRQQLVTEAGFVITAFIKRAKDTSIENMTDAAQAQKIIWDAVIPMLQQVGDLKKLEATNSKEVIRLLGQGKITVAEAKDLMATFHQQMEIEELPKLTAALEKADTGS